jgi:phosphopantothenate-cysteine ligase/phosphopantothenoylcysteine decarboxylase/phosphopantothenate--cysteine ligase
MNILITAGNTLVPIDQVRAITNIFSGRTGATLARMAIERKHDATLLTSHPETAESVVGLKVKSYRTFTDLAKLMEESIGSGQFDAVVHAAAVSDYEVAGVYAGAESTRFDPSSLTWSGGGRMLSRSAGKIRSDEPELWLRLTRTPKLIDRIRNSWRFSGVLVKFKLEVGIGDEELLVLAETARSQSAADLMVANTLAGMHDWAYLGPIQGRYERIARVELAKRVIEAVESCFRERAHA